MGPTVLRIVLYGCLFSACGGSPADPAFPELDPQNGMLEGIVDGSTFRGTGMFGGTPDVRMGWGGNFQFSSSGVGPSEGETIHGIWHDGVIPPPGSYDVSFPSPFRTGLWLFYHRTSRDGSVQFAAYEGTIEIHSSSSTEVQGSFHLRARRRCAEPTCRDADIAGAKTIELSGTFRLVPQDVSFVPL